MKKLQTMVPALFGVLALSALLASSAFAEATLPAEWLANGAKIAAALASVTTGEILLEDTKTSFGASSYLCSYILDGTVGPGGADTITKILTLAGVEIGELTGAGLECVVENLCTAPKAFPEGLPWKTELFLMEDGEILDLILGFGFTVQCTILGIKVENSCKAEDTELPVLNDPVTGDAETPGGSTATPLATCTLGGAGAGVYETDELATIALESGELLTVSSE